MNRVIPILVVLAIAILAVGPMLALRGEPLIPRQPGELTRPADAAVVIALPDRLDVQWADRAADESAYFVERSTDGEHWETLGSTPADTDVYSDTGLACETVYYYRVRSFRAADERRSAYSDTISARTGICPPAAPAGLVAMQAAADQIALTWTESAVNETALFVERSVSSGIWQVIATLPANSYTYTDSGLACGETYRYRVRAYRDGDRSTSSSDEIVVAVPGC